MRWTDTHGNVHARNVDRPACVANFFAHTNKVDSHNHLRQYCLALEKAWVMQDCWFRLHTTVTGIHTTYAFHLCQHHGLIEGSYTICEFARELSYLLLKKAKCLQNPDTPRELQTTLCFDNDKTPSPRALNMATPSPVEARISIISMVDQNGNTHHCIPYHKEKDKKGKNRTKRRQCFACQNRQGAKPRLCGQFCLCCNKSFCIPSKKKIAIASVSTLMHCDAQAAEEIARKMLILPTVSLSDCRVCLCILSCL
jgi:hypothetical protein